MLRLDEATADCLVYTFKEGLLSVVAHDLKITVRRFAIEVDEDARTVEARFAAGSLRVVCAMRDGREAPGTLSAAQMREIEDNVARHVLAADSHPEISYRSTTVDGEAGGFRVQGELTLLGRQRALPVRVRQEPGRYVASARVHQPDFGIKPYSALLGTLKVKPDVDVEVVIPFPPGHAPARS